MVNLWQFSEKVVHDIQTQICPRQSLRVTWLHINLQRQRHQRLQMDWCNVRNVGRIRSKVNIHMNILAMPQLRTWKNNCGLPKTSLLYINITRNSADIYPETGDPSFKLRPILRSGLWEVSFRSKKYNLARFLSCSRNIKMCPVFKRNQV